MHDFLGKYNLAKLTLFNIKKLNKTISVENLEKVINQLSPVNAFVYHLGIGKCILTMCQNSDAITKNVYTLDNQKFIWKTKALSKPKDIKQTG